MPTLVRRELEALFQHKFQDVEERLRPRIAEIVLNLQPRLLSLYKQSQLPLSEYGPQQGNSEQTPDVQTLSQGDNTVTALETPVTAGSEGDELGASPGIYGGADRNSVTGEGLQPPELDTGGQGVLDWDFEFDNLLNPMLFIPPGTGREFG